MAQSSSTGGTKSKSGGVSRSGRLRALPTARPTKAPSAPSAQSRAPTPTLTPAKPEVETVALYSSSEPVVVVSPLLALLEDQTRNLDKRGVPVVRVDGTVRGKARREAFEAVSVGGTSALEWILGSVVWNLHVAHLRVDQAVHRLAVDQHGTRPATSIDANRLRSSQVELKSEDVE